MGKANRKTQNSRLKKWFNLLNSINNHKNSLSLTDGAANPATYPQKFNAERDISASVFAAPRPFSGLSGMPFRP